MFLPAPCLLERIHGVLCGLLEVGEDLHTVTINVWQESQGWGEVLWWGQLSAWLLTASSFSRYVYIPVGGSQHGLLGTLFSTAVTFAFVSYWHGGYDYLWSWAALNWLGVTVENGVRRLVEIPWVQDILVSRVCGSGYLSQVD